MKQGKGGKQGEGEVWEREEKEKGEGYGGQVKEVKNSFN